MIIYLNIVIFVLTFLCVTLWTQLKLFHSSLGHPETREIIINDSQLTSLIKIKTGYQLDKIYLANSKKLYGMMPSIFRPHLILSQALFEDFDSEETEYVLLHEMAHFLLHHILTEEILGTFLLTAGLTTISALSLSFLPAILLGLIFGIVMIQFGRQHEYEADAYSLSRMTNPAGMITATQKFRDQYSTPRNKAVEAIFYRGNPFSNRIKMANHEIARRQQG